MRVLVLHSEVPDGAPPDEQDTLVQARAIADALREKGHEAHLAPFTLDGVWREAMAGRPAEAVFNLVESVKGRGKLAPLGAAALEGSGLAFTGSGAASFAATATKLIAKEMVARAGLPTPDWAQAPDWNGLSPGLWIVKSAEEDASFGLDDGAVVDAGDVPARAAHCAARYGGAWFAERFIEGREFNLSVLEENGEAHVLPVAEIAFEHWDESRPKIVSYAAKWDEQADEYRGTVRRFTREPLLEAELSRLALACFRLFGLRGYARIDFRVDAQNRPFILETNANPCLAPDAGFAAAAARAGIAYPDLIEKVLYDARTA